MRAVGERLGLAPHLVWRQPFGARRAFEPLCHDGEDDDADMRAKAAAAGHGAHRRHGVRAPLEECGLPGDARLTKFRRHLRRLRTGLGFTRGRRYKNSEREREPESRLCFVAAQQS